MLPPDHVSRRTVEMVGRRHQDRDIEHLRGLRDSISGQVVADIDPAWHQARLAWNRAPERRPPLVAYPDTIDDIRKLLAHAEARGLRVAPQATGHGAGALGALEDSLLLDMSGWREVSIDPTRRIARVAPGVTWAEVQSAAAAHGLTGLAGYSPEVGVAGYVLGGGLGWLARRYGLACNSVVAFEVVTADGRTRRVDEEHEPGLYWALRGGGGSFAILTALEIRLYPVRELYAGALFWPLDRASEILSAWREWSAALPDSVTSVGRLLRLPFVPGIPVDLRGRSFVLVEAACLATIDEGAALLRPLRDLAPEIDTFTMRPPAALGALHMDPIDPVPAFIDGWLLADLPAVAIEALVSVAGPGSGSRLLSVELRHLGAALAAATPGHGALATLEAEFAAIVVSLVPDPGTKERVEHRAGQVRAALAPWQAPRGYPNFAERSFDLADLFPPATIERLRLIKTQYDPGDLIRSTHPVPVAWQPGLTRPAG